jgi:tricarballylate dehydrogenase
VTALSTEPWDVVVAGGGNAALVAALTARAEGRRVLLLERAPRTMRGGNTRHTRNIRIAHDTADEYTPGTYPADELLSDLRSVGRGPVSLELAQLAVESSKALPAWMAEQGVRWQRALRGTLSLSRTNRFFLGGGTALANVYYRSAERNGVAIEYDANVVAIETEGRRVHAITVERPSGRTRMETRAFVAASGGFEANLEWLRRYWGDAVDNYFVRGTPYNDGNLLAALFALGAASAGDPKGFHAIAIDARSPRFDGGIATRLDAIPFSIAVNRDGVRFSDEGADIWPKRYASWGRLIAEQPGQIVYSVCDARARRHFMPSLYPPHVANTIGELARTVGLDAARLEATVAEYNRAVPPNGMPFEPEKKDGRATVGLEPPKSNWALPISEPPFYLYPLRPGITFTFLGAAVNDRAQVLDAHGAAFENLFAAGEIMSGNILSSGYLAGFGLTIGHVFGRIAGKAAASAAR